LECARQHAALHVASVVTAKLEESFPTVPTFSWPPLVDNKWDTDCVEAYWNVTNIVLLPCTVCGCMPIPDPDDREPLVEIPFTQWKSNGFPGSEIL
jgi:hypothetical protein